MPEMLVSAGCSSARAMRARISGESKCTHFTGVVVSMGKVAKEKAEFTIGDRVLFGQYSGQFIPTKTGVALKTMDWYNVINVIGGAEELGAFDFINKIGEEEGGA